MDGMHVVQPEMIPTLNFARTSRTAQNCAPNSKTGVKFYEMDTGDIIGDCLQASAHDKLLGTAG